MNYKLGTKEALFRITLEEKLYELYPYSAISVYTSTLTDTEVLEMTFFLKGKKIGLRHEVSLKAIEYYDLNLLIKESVLNIQREITDRRLREERDNDTSTKES